MAEVTNEYQAKERIISLAPNITEILFSIGKGDSIVGVTDYDVFPEQVKSLPRVGGYLDPDIEEIIRLSPTRIVMLEGKANLQSKLQDLGFIISVYKIESLNELVNAITDLGNTFRKEREAANLINTIHTALDSARNIAKSPQNVLMVLGSESPVMKSQFAVCKDSFLNDIITSMGYRNIFGDIPVSYSEVTLEEIIRRQPQIVIELSPKTGFDSKISDDEIKKKWSDLLSIPASTSHRISVLHQEYLLIPGPRIVMTIDALKRIFNQWTAD